MVRIKRNNCCILRILREEVSITCVVHGGHWLWSQFPLNKGSFLLLCGPHSPYQSPEPIIYLIGQLGHCIFAPAEVCVVCPAEVCVVCPAAGTLSSALFKFQTVY